VIEAVLWLSIASLCLQVLSVSLSLSVLAAIQRYVALQVQKQANGGTHDNGSED
jgi:hypothetical protein